MPGLPGAAISWPQLGDCLRRQASASSRPPEPRSRIFMDLPDDTRGGLLANVAPGDNSPRAHRQRAFRRAQADDRERVRPGPRPRRDQRLQAPCLGPLLFHAEGRECVHRRGDLARQARARSPSGPRTAPRSSRPASSRPIPGRSKYQIVVERMELAGEGALLALLEKRRKALAAEGPVRCRAQAQAAVPAARDRRRHLADRRGDPRHPPSARGPLPDARHPVAGAGAGRGRGGEDRRGDPRLSRRIEPRPDLLIVARGGGSIEDLWAVQRGRGGARRGRIARSR